MSHLEFIEGSFTAHDTSSLRSGDLIHLLHLCALAVDLCLNSEIFLETRIAAREETELFFQLGARWHFLDEFDLFLSGFALSFQIAAVCDPMWGLRGLVTILFVTQAGYQGLPEALGGRHNGLFALGDQADGASSANI